jgi:hypothetical protein
VTASIPSSRSTWASFLLDHKRPDRLVLVSKVFQPHDDLPHIGTSDNRRPSPRRPIPKCDERSSGAKSVERSLKDWLDVTGVGVDCRDGDDHVEDLLEGEVVADFAGLLRGSE